MRLLVFGGRDYRDRDRLWAKLDEIHAETQITEVIEGGQVSFDHAEKHLPWHMREKWGADYFGGQWAISRGIKRTQVCAEWIKFGKSAGPRRNQVMASLEPDLAVQCPGGNGTRDMRSRLKCVVVEV